MKLALFGLGKMGLNMARRLCRGAIAVVGYNRLQTIEQSIAVPVMTYVLFVRFTSQDQKGYGNGLLAMMRNVFGGHAIIHNDNAANDAQGGGNA